MGSDAGDVIRRVLKKTLSGYGVPAGLFAVFVSIIIYAVSFRSAGPASGFFPRSPSEFMEPRRLDRRLGELAERIRNNSTDIQALFESGMLKYQKGQAAYLDAIADLESARARGLADVRAFYYLGQMYQAEGLYDFALQEYERFINNRPDDFEVRMLIAKLLYAAGKYPRAAAEYENLNARYPKNMLVLENLALSRFKNGQDAAPVLEMLRSAGPEAARRADYIRGRIYYETGDYSSAAPLLAGAVSNMKSSGPAETAGLYRMLGDCYIRLKAGAEAAAALSELLKINPDDDEARSQLARLARAQKSKVSKAQGGKGAK